MISFGLVEHSKAPATGSRRSAIVSPRHCRASASGSNPIVNFRRIDRADVDIGSEVPAAWVRSKLSIGIAGRATGGQQQRQTQNSYRQPLHLLSLRPRLGVSPDFSRGDGSDSSADSSSFAGESQALFGTACS